MVVRLLRHGVLVRVASAGSTSTTTSFGRREGLAVPISAKVKRPIGSSETYVLASGVGSIAIETTSQAGVNGLV